MSTIKDLKEKFVEFCNKFYPNRARKTNRFNSKQWFYVQIGRFFSDYIHCEYHNNNIELHIEFDRKEENNKFAELLEKLIPNLQNCVTQKHSIYKWYILVPEIEITDDKLFEQMGKKINEIDEAIEMSEFFIKKYFDR